MNDRTAFDKKTGGWFRVSWKSREAVRRFTDGAESTATALAILDALFEVAHKKGRYTFVEYHVAIAALAGCSVPTLKRILPTLKHAGVAIIDTPPRRGPCSYTLLSVELLAHNEPTLAQGGGTPRLSYFDKTPEETSEKTSDETPQPPKGGGGDSDSSTEKTRDPAFLALASVGGADPAQLTETAARGVRRKLAELRRVDPDVTADEIQRRARLFREKHPTWPLTAASLVKHWAEFPQPRAVSTPPHPVAVAAPEESCGRVVDILALVERAPSTETAHPPRHGRRQS